MNPEILSKLTLRKNITIYEYLKVLQYMKEAIYYNYFNELQWSLRTQSSSILVKFFEMQKSEFRFEVLFLCAIDLDPDI